MWFDTLDLMPWLGQVLGLFDDIYGAISSVPVLRLFLASFLFLIVFSLLVLLIQRGRKGRL